MCQRRLIHHPKIQSSVDSSRFALPSTHVEPLAVDGIFARKQRTCSIPDFGCIHISLRVCAIWTENIYLMFHIKFIKNVVTHSCISGVRRLLLLCAGLRIVDFYALRSSTTTHPATTHFKMRTQHREGIDTWSILLCFIFLRAHAKEFKRRSDFLCVHALLCFFHVSHIFPFSSKTPQTREFSFRRQMPDDEWKKKRFFFVSLFKCLKWNLYFSFGNADAF